MWYVKKFDELTTRELYEIYRLRCQVFIVEQNCAYVDIDEIDPIASHIFFKEESIIAYARFFESGDAVKLGRIVTPKEYRGTGLGLELVQRTIDEALRLNKTIIISAQEYLDNFYQRMGFEKTSDVYLEDGIPHQDMVYRGPDGA